MLAGVAGGSTGVAMCAVVLLEVPRRAGLDDQREVEVVGLHESQCLGEGDGVIIVQEKVAVECIHAIKHAVLWDGLLDENGQVAVGVVPCKILESGKAHFFGVFILVIFY